MTRDNPQDETADSSDGLGDPWAAFGYLVAGVAFYGLIGWGLGEWLNAIWLVPVGILVGAGLGLYLVYAKLGRIPPSSSPKPTQPGNTQLPRSTRPDDPPRSASDDRGDTE
jgi:ATP synthase protein I